MTAALITIGLETIGGEPTQSVTAKDLYEKLCESTSQLSRWQITQIESLGLVKGLDYEVFDAVSKSPLGGRPSETYVFALEAAKHIALASRTEKGKQLRQYFIEVERQAKQGSTLITAETAKHLAAFAGALSAIERKYDYELEQNKRVERIQAIEWKERKRLDKTVKELRKEITELRQAVPDKPKDPNGPVLVHEGLRVLGAKRLPSDQVGRFYNVCGQVSQDHNLPVGKYKTKKGVIVETFVMPVIKLVAGKFNLL